MSAGTSYSILKLTASSVDPYTRSAIGTVVGFALVLSSYDNHRFIGIGAMIAGALQIIDVTKRGRLVKNQYNLPVYVIGENSGISVLEFGQVPSYTIDGFSFKGLHGVFKFFDGIYAKINLNNKVQYTSGLGKFINQNVRSGGYKAKQWVDQQTDLERTICQINLIWVITAAIQKAWSRVSTAVLGSLNIGFSNPYLC